MRLTRPKQLMWWIAVGLGVLGLLGHWGIVAPLAAYAFWLVTAGLVVLTLATLWRDLWLLECAGCVFRARRALSRTIPGRS